MPKTTYLDELKKKYLSESATLGMPDSYDLYKHKNGLNTAKSYSEALNNLYASSKKALSTYGSNSRTFNNKGLQNSGYAEYIDKTASDAFTKGAGALKSSYAEKEANSLGSYASYLEEYRSKQESAKDKVLSHLVDNEIVDLPTAIAYGINAGLSFDDAKSIGQSAYGVTRNKIANEILKQSASLGLDQNGAKMLAVKMGLTETDAQSIAKEVSEMLEYYRSISADYLEFLAQRS